jgi:hypothetical protein
MLTSSRHKSNIWKVVWIVEDTYHNFLTLLASFNWATHVSIWRLRSCLRMFMFGSAIWMLGHTPLTPRSHISTNSHTTLNMQTFSSPNKYGNKHVSFLLGICDNTKLLFLSSSLFWLMGIIIGSTVHRRLCLPSFSSLEPFISECDRHGTPWR